MIGTLPRRERVGTASARFSTAVHVACLVLGVASLVGSFVVAFSPRGILPHTGVFRARSGGDFHSWDAIVRGSTGTTSAYHGGFPSKFGVAADGSPVSESSDSDKARHSLHLTISDAGASGSQSGNVTDRSWTWFTTDLLSSPPMRPGSLATFSHSASDTVVGVSRFFGTTSLGVEIPTEPFWESVVLDASFSTTKHSDPWAMSRREGHVKFSGRGESGEPAAPGISLQRMDSRSFPSESTSWESELSLRPPHLSVRRRDFDSWGDSEHSFTRTGTVLWFSQDGTSRFGLKIDGEDGRVECFHPELGEAVYPFRCYSFPP